MRNKLVFLKKYFKVYESFRFYTGSCLRKFLKSTNLKKNLIKTKSKSCQTMGYYGIVKYGAVWYNCREEIFFWNYRTTIPYQWIIFFKKFLT